MRSKFVSLVAIGAAIVLGMTPSAANADSRAEPPLPLQVNLAGLAAVSLAVIGAATVLGMTPAVAKSDSRAERPLQLQVDLAGLTVGYHFNDLIYVGATHQLELDGEEHGVPRGFFERDDDGSLYGQQGVLDNDLDLGARSAIEVRISPWEFGLYFAAGVIQVQATEQHVEWDQRARRVGQGDYITGLTADVEGDKVTAPAVGFGYNHVFAFGLSLNAGVLVGLFEPDSPDVEVSATNPGITDDVNESDLQLFRDKVADDFPDDPVLIHIAFGYNF